MLGKCLAWVLDSIAQVWTEGRDCGVYKQFFPAYLCLSHLVCLTNVSVHDPAFPSPKIILTTEKKCFVRTWECVGIRIHGPLQSPPSQCSPWNFRVTVASMHSSALPLLQFSHNFHVFLIYIFCIFSIQLSVSKTFGQLHYRLRAKQIAEFFHASFQKAAFKLRLALDA